MIARLMLGVIGVAGITVGSSVVSAQPWRSRDLGPPPDLPAATGLTRADQVAMRLLIEAQITAMRAGDWLGAFALASPDLQEQYGTPAAFRDDVTAHYGPGTFQTKLRSARMPSPSFSHKGLLMVCQ
jgi:hypothetical protein